MTSENNKNTSVTPISDPRPNLEEAIRRRRIKYMSSAAAKMDTMWMIGSAPKPKSTTPP